jgi:hypothetical protein
MSSLQSSSICVALFSVQVMTRHLTNVNAATFTNQYLILLTSEKRRSMCSVPMLEALKCRISRERVSIACWSILWSRVMKRAQIKLPSRSYRGISRPACIIEVPTLLARPHLLRADLFGTGRAHHLTTSIRICLLIKFWRLLDISSSCRFVPLE